MLRWRREIDDSGSVAYLAVASDSHPSDSLATAREIWKGFGELVMPIHSAIEWNVVRVEVWPDSGRSIVFPDRSNAEVRIDRAALSVEWPSLLEAWQRLERDDSVDDSTFDEIIGRKVGEMVGWLRNAYLAEAYRDIGSAVEFYEYGEDLIDVIRPSDFAS